MKRLRQSSGIFGYFLLYRLVDGRRRINGYTVPRMDARSLDMLHNAGNQDIRAVTDSIHFNLLPLQILVHQNRMILCNPVDDCHKLLNLLVGNGNLHPLSAKHIGRAHQHGIAQTVGHLLGLFCRIHGSACRSGNLRLLQYPVEQLSVLRSVHIFRLCPQNGHAHLHQTFRQLNGRLPAELNHRPVGMLDIDNGLHILRRQGFKIQLVRYVKIRTYGLRIIIDNNGLISCLGKSPCGMYGTIVEFDSLSDADRPGAKHQYLPALFRRTIDILSIVCRQTFSRHGSFRHMSVRRFP